MKKLVVCVLLSLALAGCSHKYRVDSYDGPTSRLSRQASFYVMLPANGRYDAETYVNSGRQTAQAVTTALASHVNSIKQAETVEDLNTAMERARAANITYVFETVILHWEDRATEWSGIPDKITIKYAVHDVASGKLLSSSVSRASSKWGTLGGDHPQDLLPAPTQQFVRGLF